MIVSRVDHISIAVKDYEKAVRFFGEVLGAVAIDQGAEPEDGYFWQTFSLGDLSRLEIISPISEHSFLKGFLRSRGAGGVHHITLQTPDIKKAVCHLEAHGIPFFGYHESPDSSWKEVFIHPRHAFGVLIQIAEFEGCGRLPCQLQLPENTTWQIEEREDGADLVFSNTCGYKVSVTLDRGELMRFMKAIEGVL